MIEEVTIARMVAKRVEEVTPRWRVLGIFRVGKMGTYQVTAEDVEADTLVNVRLEIDPTDSDKRSDRDLVPVSRDAAFYILGALDAHTSRLNNR